jgi:cyclase
MKKHCHAVLLLAVMVLLSIPGFLFSQYDDSARIVTTSITESLYVISNDQGGNIGVLEGKDGIVIIDTHRKQFTERIQEKISEISNKPVNYVINTHWHMDHIEGNEVFGGQGSLIIAHENCRTRLANDQLISLIMYNQEATPHNGLPKLTFSDSIRLYLNDEVLLLSYFENVHTDSDVVIHFERSNVIHMGDIFVRYGVPFIDVQNGGDIDGMISTCERIISIADENTIIIPGHGPVSNKQDLINYTDMIKTIRHRIAEDIERGKTLDQIVESDPAKEYNFIFDKAGLIKLYYDSIVENE